MVVAGLLVLQHSSKAAFAACVGLGALGYTAVNSAGYYAQAGEWMPVVMFGVVATSTVLALIRTFNSPGSTPRSGHPVHGDATTTAVSADRGRPSQMGR